MYNLQLADKQKNKLGKKQKIFKRSKGMDKKECKQRNLQKSRKRIEFLGKGNEYL